MTRAHLTAAAAFLKIVVSAGLLAVLLSQADLRFMWTQVRHMNLAWTVAALATYAAMLGVSAWRWRLLLRLQTVDVSFGRLTQSFLVATFFNNFLPSNIGGDVVRVADTAPHTGSKTLATTVVLLDRVLGLVALLALAAIASALGTWSGIPFDGVRYLWIALAGLVGALLFVLMNPDAISRLVGAAAVGRTDWLQQRFRSLLTAIGRFGTQPRGLWSAFAGAIAVQALLVVFYVCAAHSFAVPLSMLAASVIVPVSLVVQMLPLSINGFGVREAVFTFFFRSLGLDVSSALTLSLGSTGLIMLFSLSGGIVFLTRPRRSLEIPEATAELS